MMAPASRSRATNVASSGGRSFAYCASAPDVVRMSRVVLILDGDHDAVERADEPCRCARMRGPAAAAVSSASGMLGGAVRAIGQAARLARVEAPAFARRGPEIQRGQRVDLPGVRDGRDRTEDALRLIDARAVVGLDALQILLDDPDRGDAPALDGALDVGDGRFVYLKCRPLRVPWPWRRESTPAHRRTPAAGIGCESCSEPYHCWNGVVQAFSLP